MAKPANLMTSEILHIPATVQRLIDQQGERIAELAMELKDAARKGVTFAARGTSDNACLYGKYLFEILLGYPVHLAAPSTVTLYRRPMDFAGKLVIGVSQSGESTDVCEYMEAAAKAGARTIGITNNPKSRLAKSSEFHIPLLAGPEKAVAATKTYVGELLVLRMLVTCMTAKKSLHDALPLLPEAIEAAMSTEDRIKEIVPRFRYMHAAVVLGRGYNYATAQEFALKLMETSHVPVHPFSFADFLHGPVSVMHQGFPSFVFLSKGPTANGVKELMTDVHGRGGELVVFSNTKIKENATLWPVYVDAPLNEVDSPLVNIIPAYLFAKQYSLLCGFDPDNPKGLTKVTHTR